MTSENGMPATRVYDIVRLLWPMCLCGFLGFVVGCWCMKSTPNEIPALRVGDKVLIMQGFYSGEPARIGHRRKQGGEYVYELLGDGKIAIDSDTWFRQSEFVLRDVR